MSTISARYWSIIVLVSRISGLCTQSASLPQFQADDGRAASAPMATLDHGDARYRAGDLAGAAAYWADTLKQRKPSDPGASIRTALKLTAAYQRLGQQRLASETADHAAAIAETDHRASLPLVKNVQGTIAILDRDYPLAEQLLSQALALAHESGESALEALSRHNLGTLELAQNNYRGALEHFDSVLKGSKALVNQSLACRAHINSARASLGLRQFDEASSRLDRATAVVTNIGHPYDRIILQLSLGQAAAKLARESPAAAEKSRQLSRQCYAAAEELARNAGDARSRGYALGYMGELYVDDHQPVHAVGLFNQAAFHAQQASLPDALYRWRWGLGRIEAQGGRRSEAIRHYRRAVQTVAGIQHDLLVGAANDEASPNFRELVGSLFTELIDLLLQEAEDEPELQKKVALLYEARDTQESLKSAELEDYFRDECVSIALSKVKPVEKIAAGTAVVYIIPLPDRTELLLSLTDGMARFAVPVPQRDLFDTADQLRLTLEKRTTYEYLRPAQALHRALIDPLLPTLVSNQIDTLIFVPQGALGTVPFGALATGTNHLIDRFAVAMTPGLTLMSPQPIRLAKSRLLLAGLGEAVQGFPQLQYAPGELQQVHQEFGGTLLIDRDFRADNVEKLFAKNAYSIVHIASHGRFQGLAAETFLLTYDGRLTLNQLERLIKPSQFRGQPVELLTLSACETASGDERAALGLAGVAVKAGARSALATLWCVNDEATSVLIEEFYNQVRRNCPKAKALQQAQKKLIADPRFQHPAYWSPYLMIGNWL